MLQLIHSDSSFVQRNPYPPYAYESVVGGELLYPRSPALLEERIQRMRVETPCAEYCNCRSHPLECVAHRSRDIIHGVPVGQKTRAFPFVLGRNWESHPGRETKPLTYSSLPEPRRSPQRAGPCNGAFL